MRPDDMDRLLDRSREALEAGDAAAALAAARRVVDAVGEPRGDRLVDLVVEAELLAVEACGELARDDEALARLQHVHRLAPDDPEARFLEGRLRLLRWELDEAERLLGGPAPPAELLGEVLYHRAIVADLRRRFGEADRLYAEAARRDPDRCPAPVRMPDAEARALLRSLIESFPPDVRGTLDNVGIEIDDVPDPVLDRAPGVDPLVLGLYHGVPITEKVDAAPSMPDRVRIFKRNIERLAPDRDSLLEQLRITLLHEVGHHLGWDEDDLEARGLG